LADEAIVVPKGRESRTPDLSPANRSFVGIHEGAMTPLMDPPVARQSLASE
jgi:hypothetical protein